MFPPSDNRLGRPLARLLASLAGIIVCGAARADDTGNVGVLHSFSGTVAISESTCRSRSS